MSLTGLIAPPAGVQAGSIICSVEAPSNASTWIFGQLINNGLARIDIRDNGTVTFEGIYAGSSLAWVTLSGMVYSI
jgi:hypothetical protein